MGNNLTVFANATLAGGNYGKIRVFGSVEAFDDITAFSMTVFGSGNFTAKCVIDKLKLFGSCTFSDFVEAKEMNIKGSCKFNSDVKVDYLKVFGEANFNKNMFRSTEVRVYGDMKVNVLESDNIYIRGKITCDNEINGDKIKIASYGGSVIKELLGTEIIIKPKRRYFLFKVKKQRFHINFV